MRNKCLLWPCAKLSRGGYDPKVHPKNRGLTAIFSIERIYFSLALLAQGWLLRVVLLASIRSSALSFGFPQLIMQR